MITVTVDKINGVDQPNDIRAIQASDIVFGSLRPLTANNTATAAVFKINAQDANGVPIIQEWQITESYAATLIAITQDSAADGAELLVNKNATSGYSGIDGTYRLQLKNVAGTFTSYVTNTNAASRVYTLPDATGTIALAADVALKADLASPTLTGVPAAPTAATGTNTTQLATTQFVQGEFDARSVIIRATLVAGVVVFNDVAYASKITASSRVFVGNVTALNASVAIGVAHSVVNVAATSCTVTMLKSDGTTEAADVSERVFTVVF